MAGGGLEAIASAAMEQFVGQGQQVVKAFSSITNLTDLYYAYKALPFRWVLAVHSLFVSTLADDFKGHFLMHFWVCFLAGFGGGVTSALMLMNPLKAPIVLLTNNDVGIFYTIGWWLMNCFPFGLVRKFYKSTPLAIIGKLGTTLLRAQLMISRVDIAAELFPGVIAAPLILGTVAGAGGKFVCDIIRHGWGCLPTPPEAAAPTFIWRSGLMGSAFYWGCAYAAQVLSKEEAAALLISVLLLHSLISDLVGPKFTDFTYPIFRTAHAISLVPVPGTPAALPAPAKAIAAKAPASKAAVKTTAPAAAPKASVPAPYSAAAAAAVPAAAKPSSAAAVVVSASSAPVADAAESKAPVQTQPKQQSKDAWIAPSSGPWQVQGGSAKGGSGKGGKGGREKGTSENKKSK